MENNQKVKVINNVIEFLNYDLKQLRDKRRNSKFNSTLESSDRKLSGRKSIDSRSSGRKSKASEYRERYE